jgi:tetratricopeptide (TPR) repeat protein
VQLTDAQNHVALAPAEVETDGTFEFRHVPVGTYRLTVSEDGQPIYDDLVTVRETAPPITLEVQSRETARPPVGPVSVDQLLHPPARKAFAAFVSARGLSDAGKHEKAAEQLEKAIRISPDYAEAWVNLAVQHIYLGHYQQALEELSHAAEISRPTVLLLVDTAWVQSILRRNDEAVHSARQALQMDPSCAPAHYLLGSLLALNRNTLPEAVRHLEQAARTIPAAQQNLDRAQRQLAQTATHP